MTAPAVDVCRQGHVLTDANTYINAGHRRCRTCRTQRRRESAKRRRDNEINPTGDVRIVAGPGDSSIPVGRWQERASCRNAPVGAFFANDGEAGIPTRARRAATAYCADCPVRALCDQEATNRREIGLWAGAWRERGKSTANYRITNLIPAWLGRLDALLYTGEEPTP